MKIVPILAAIALSLCAMPNNPKQGDYENINQILAPRPTKKEAINPPKDQSHQYVLDTSSDFEYNLSDNYEYEGDLSNQVGSSNYDENGNLIQEAAGQPFATIDNVTQFTSTLAFEDSRESNDDFASASAIYKAGTDKGGIFKHSVWLDATINQKKSGWWLWEKTYIDKDFYTFDAVSEGTLTIDLTNIPSNCDYDIRVFRLGNFNNTSYKNLDFNDSKYLVGTGYAGVGQSEHVVVKCVPTTYYIAVFSHNDETYDDEHPYHLKVTESVDSSVSGSFYDIAQGRKSGDRGAIWVSDFDPIGITPITISDDTARQHIPNYYEYPMINHLGSIYGESNDINYAVVYVWDLETRAAIYGVVSEMINQIYTLDWDDNSSQAVSVGLSAAGLAVTVAGIGVGLVSLALTGPAAATAAALLNLVSLKLNAASIVLSLASLVTSFTMGPSINTNKINLINYLINLKAAFEIGVGSNNNEVIMMKFRYHFEDTDYLNWSPLYRSSDTNRYNQSSISYQIEGSPIDGKVHGFSDQNELNRFLRS